MEYFLVFFLVLRITLAQPVPESIRSSEPNCIDCHNSVMNYSVKHEAMDAGCDLCHMATGESHPQNTVQGFTLTEPMPGLCFMCHEEHTKTNLHEVSTECLMCHSPHGSAYNSLLIQSPESAICTECHDMSMTENRVKHLPVDEGNCANCHNPHQSEFAYLLIKEKKQLCISCHSPIQKLKEFPNIHPPYEDDCGNCHDSHSSDEEGLLIQKMPDLCFNCHDLETTLENSSIIHKALNYKNGCSNCHSPHTSDQNKLLLMPDKDLCLSCHNKSITDGERTTSNIGQFLKSGNYIHPIIELEGCSVCHNPHASENQDLLNETFPFGPYSKAQVNKFELCFKCHDSQLMTEEITTSATNFRNGEKNMHFLHINGDKGRNCNICHNIHGSAYEHLITEKVMFGNWEMPMQYKIETKGGSCKTGCHAEKKYFR
ncbi:MAG: cytochrome c3 family protein [Bacteroidales bacterium]|nr:cytochrome c3 family protein [Bacteroidales bacterium]MCF8392014.1 cytochrome c3 family protein [Bacteroidales bacterium]